MFAWTVNALIIQVLGKYHLHIVIGNVQSTLPTLGAQCLLPNLAERHRAHASSPIWQACESQAQSMLGGDPRVGEGQTEGAEPAGEGHQAVIIQEAHHCRVICHAAALEYISC